MSKSKCHGSHCPFRHPLWRSPAKTTWLTFGGFLSVHSYAEVQLIVSVIKLPVGDLEKLSKFVHSMWYWKCLPKTPRGSFPSFSVVSVIKRHLTKMSNAAESTYLQSMAKTYNPIAEKHSGLLRKNILNHK